MSLRLSTLAILFCLHASAQQSLNVLFLGNSYTGVNNLPLLIANVAAGAGDTLTYNSNTPGGYTLENHINDLTSMGLVQQGEWDYVVAQEQSQLPSWQDYTSAGPSYLSVEVEDFNPCGRTMFYMTWGRKNGDASNCAIWPPVCTYEGMDSMLRMRYFEMATLNKSELSPVGKVWNRLRHLYPSIELYQPDESHPSEAGSYAAACCFYAALFKSDPTTTTYDYTLPPADAAIIRQVAKEVVYDSLSLYDFTQPDPQASFYYTVEPGNNKLRFLNTCSNANSYLWEFGDGDTSTAYQPVHTYLNDGTYQVTLHAKDCDLNQTFEDTMIVEVSFCNFTPVVSPDTIRLCPGSSDTLWTQQYDSYQWLDWFGDPVAGETNRFFVPTFQGRFSVLATSQGCSERSYSSRVEDYMNNMVVYNIDTSFIPDTVCYGDTVDFILYPNRPVPPIFVFRWYKDGIQLPFNGDTLRIAAPGEYYVTVENMICVGIPFFYSDHVYVDFENCNISVGEISKDDIAVYPQPVKDILVLKSNGESVLRYKIIDIFGREILSGIHSKQTIIDFSRMKSGLYFVRMNDSVYKIIKN